MPYLSRGRIPTRRVCARVALANLPSCEPFRRIGDSYLAWIGCEGDGSSKHFVLSSLGAARDRSSRCPPPKAHLIPPRSSAASRGPVHGLRISGSVMPRAQLISNGVCTRPAYSLVASSALDHSTLATHDVLRQSTSFTLKVALAAAAASPDCNSGVAIADQGSSLKSDQCFLIFSSSSARSSATRFRRAMGSAFFSRADGSLVEF